MNRVWSRRELLLVVVLSMAGAAAVLAEPLFFGKATLSFRLDDPRVDLRPWVGGEEAGKGLMNPISPDANGFVLPGVIRARQLRDSRSGLLWDSSQLLGYPFAANLPVPVASPPFWFFQGWIPGIPAADPVTVMDLMLWFHLAAALALGYRAARLMGIDPPYAALAAVGFAFSAWMYTKWHAGHMLYTAAWWPGQAAAVIKLREGQQRRGVVEGALFTGLMMVSGFPQVAFLLTGCSVLLGLANRKALASLAAMVVLGCVLAGPQLLLSAGAYKQSLRSHPETRAATAERGLPPVSLVSLVLPEFFGRPSDFSLPSKPAPTMEEWLPQRKWWKNHLRNNPIANAIYPGMIVLLACAALLRRKAGRLFLILAALALTAAMVGPAVASIWPQVTVLAAGCMKRVLVIFAVCLPLAAAFGLKAMGDQKAPVPWVTGAVLLLGLAAISLASMMIDDPDADRFTGMLVGQSARQALFVVLGLVSFALAARKGLRWLPALILATDLVLLAWAFNPFPEQTVPYPETPAVARLVQNKGRVAVFGRSTLLMPTAAGIHGLRSVTGIMPMPSMRVAELLETVEKGLFDMRDPRVAFPFMDPRSLSHPLLDLLGVESVVHDTPGLDKITGFENYFVHHKEGLAALKRTTPGPRAFLCGGAKVKKDKAQRLALLKDPDFSFRNTVILEKQPLLDLSEAGEFQALELDSGFHLTVEAGFPGVVVLTEAWDPGWRALVDGEEKEVHPVDHALMGVEVKEGRHEMTFVYQPKGLGLSYLFSVISLGVILMLALSVWYNSKRDVGGGG